MTTHGKDGSSAAGRVATTSRLAGEPAVIDLGDDVVRVLSISPNREDHDVLRRVLRGRNWKIQEASTLSDSSQRLRRNAPALVVCESDCARGMWQEILNQISAIPRPPRLILTSRLADERFWAEALNLGAFDVLAKPLEAKELIRTLSLGWLQRKFEEERSEQSVTRAPRPRAGSRVCGGQVA